MMVLYSNSIDNGRPIPERHAFCVQDPAQRARPGDNVSPHIGWEDLPDGARSLVLLCHDPDVPGRPDDVNREDREIPADLERVDFYHWVLVDIDPARLELAEGEFSRSVTPGGKSGPEGPHDTRQGHNSYTGLFAGDEQMKGEYFGYDGPCPPWNDSIAHHYVFTLYVLDIERCPVEGTFTGPEVREAMRGHVLDQASITGTYSMNPRVTA